MKKIVGIITLVALATVFGVTSCKKAIVQPVGLGNEVDFSSPIIPVGDSWSGSMGGLLEVNVSYDTTTHTIAGTVKNISNQKLCWALSEPHMKLVGQTVGELGPEKLGDIAPGQTVNTSLTITTDPKYTGYTYDGYVVHMEVFDCSAGAPPPY